MKRLIASILTGFMVMSLSVVPAFATETTTGDELSKAKTELQQKKADVKALKQKKQTEAKAAKLAKPKVLQGFVDRVDTAAGVLYLKKGGAQGGILVNAKTVLSVVEADGARTCALSEFVKGDKVFGLVRRSADKPQQLTGLVLVRMPAKEKKADDTETPPAAPETTPPADTTTPPADTTTPPADTTTPAADATTPPADTTTPPADTTTPATTN